MHRTYPAATRPRGVASRGFSPPSFSRDHLVAASFPLPTPTGRCHLRPARPLARLRPSPPEECSPALPPRSRPPFSLPQGPLIPTSHSLHPCPHTHPDIPLGSPPQTHLPTLKSTCPRPLPLVTASRCLPHISPNPFRLDRMGASDAVQESVEKVPFLHRSRGVLPASCPYPATIVAPVARESPPRRHLVACPAATTNRPRQREKS